MISDVLFEAVAEIDRYMDEDDDGFPNRFYGNDLGLRLIGLRNRMDAMRRELDTTGPLSKPTLRKRIRWARICARQKLGTVILP